MRVGSLCVLGMAVAATSAPAVRAAAAPVELVSAGTTGVSANHHSGSSGVTPPGRRISGDGRYVVFESNASNLACSDPNVSTNDIFVRDRLTGATTDYSFLMSRSFTTSYTYDYNGNTTSKTVGSDTTTYAWDYENRLTSVTFASTHAKLTP